MSKNKGEIPISQHYLAQFYLRSLTDGGHSVYLFDVKARRANPKSTYFKSFFCVDLLYEQDKNNPTGETEKLLGVHESKWGSVLKSVVGTLDTSRHAITDGGECIWKNRFILFEFCYAQILRTERGLNFIRKCADSIYADISTGDTVLCSDKEFSLLYDRDCIPLNLNIVNERFRIAYESGARIETTMLADMLKTLAHFFVTIEITSIDVIFGDYFWISDLGVKVINNSVGDIKMFTCLFLLKRNVVIAMHVREYGKPILHSSKSKNSTRVMVCNGDAASIIRETLIWDRGINYVVSVDRFSEKDIKEINSVLDRLGM